MIPLAHTGPQPKRHLDRLSRFAALTTVTDRLTDHAISNNRPHLRTGM